MESAEMMYRAATSKSMHRILIYISLLLAASIPLLVVAIISTLSFYHNYLPDQVFSTPVYLQYGIGAHPFGTASLTEANLKTHQAYDIAVVLSVPQSPANADRGNFMVTLHLLGPGLPSSGNELHYLLDLESLHREKKIRFSSSRPALLPYRDPLVSLASRLLFLGYHLLVPESQALTVRIPMGEQVELATQYSEMPVLAYLEINAGQILQTYDASIVMTAQLRGLRWLMYQYRLPVFILATLLFWAAEMLFMIAAWATWSARASASSGTQTRGSASPETAAAVKRDEAGLDEFSSTATTTLPAYSIRENPEHELHNREWAPDNEQDHASPARPGGGVDELESDVRWVRDDIGVGKGASDMGSVRRRSSHRRLT